jgi:hypothetical protein
MHNEMEHIKKLYFTRKFAINYKELVKNTESRKQPQMVLETHTQIIINYN